MFYFRGNGVPQDYAESANWYREAAKKGMARAQDMLGWMYSTGKGVPQDFSESVKWHSLAAEQGLTAAQVSLAYMHENGNGVPTDNVTAHMWYDIALANGSDQGDTVERRDKLAANMTPAEISIARLRARICVVSDYKDCE